MLTGPRVALRSPRQEDAEIFITEIYDDVDTWSRLDDAGWRPMHVGAQLPWVPHEANPALAAFTVVERDAGEVLGAASLWGIDLHNRRAHLGVSLRPSARARGLGTEVVGVLCDYGFRVLGLHRLSIETLADNAAMRGVADAAGFRLEGTSRSSSWVGGAFLDDVQYGLLAEEWDAKRGAR